MGTDVVDVEHGAVKGVAFDMAGMDPARIDQRAAGWKLRGSFLKRINRQAKLFAQQQDASRGSFGLHRVPIL